MADFNIEAFRPENPQIQQRAGRPPAAAGAEGAFGTGAPAAGGKELSFRETIRNFVHDVDGVQKEATKKIEDFMAGEIADVHDVMIAVEKAGTSFQLLMELRNKMLNAYQEIKRMSV
ncbi:MAG: flagellar hook-basal body complex protein FliE [Gemmatimonadota bacterium]|nr:flagellar hook-basal body complex protein FliE [Gemmatimonadota bacterium]